MSRSGAFGDRVALNNERVKAENEEMDSLQWAAASRILTDLEMKKLSEVGVKIFVRHRPTQDGWGKISGSYNQLDLERRLNELLLQQFRLRSEIAKKSASVLN